MSKRKRRTKTAPAKSEPQSVDMLTVGWMLSVTTALLCEVGFLLARAYLLLIDDTASRMAVLAGMLLFAAAVVGVSSLALCAAVLKLKRVSPPGSVIVSAVAVGALPLAIMLFNSLRQV